MHDTCGPPPLRRFVASSPRRFPAALGLAVAATTLSPAVGSEADITEQPLADGVVLRIHADGRRVIAVGSTELADRTPAPQPPPAHVTADDRRRGFILYRRDPDGVFRHSSPRVEERLAGRRIALSLGETGHVPIALYALQDLGRVTVSAAPPAPRAGPALPAGSLTVRPVRIGLWRNYWDPWYQEAPKLIGRPGAPVQAPAGESRQVWVTLEAPGSAAPGRYHTVLRIEPEHGATADLPLAVDVLPFRLAPGRWWGIYYYAGFNENTPRDFADMKAHGVNAMLLCPPGNREPLLERRGDRVIASFPLTDRAMAELKRQGFDRPIAFYPRLLSCRVLRLFDRIDGDRVQEARYYGQLAARYEPEDFPADLRPVLADVFRQMVRHAKEADWPPILWYLVDEPGAGSGHTMEMAWAEVEFPLFAETCPDEALLCTAYSQEAVDRIGVRLDVRVGDLWRLGPDDLARTERDGARLWGIRWLCQYNTYGFPRHFAGLGLDAMGLHGFTEWTYYGAPLYRPHDQLRNQHGCHYAFVDDEGHLLSTITWEAVQTGIDDARYVATLRRLIERAAASDTPTHVTLAESARAALQAILADIPPKPHTMGPDDLDALRGRITAQILRFVEAGITAGDS